MCRCTYISDIKIEQINKDNNKKNTINEFYYILSILPLYSLLKALVILIRRGYTLNEIINPFFIVTVQVIQVAFFLLFVIIIYLKFLLYTNSGIFDWSCRFYGRRVNESGLNHSVLY